MTLNVLFTIDSILTAVLFLLASFALFFIGKFAYNLFHRNINVDHELVEKDNFAFAIDQVGYYVGLLLAIGSALVGEGGHDVWTDLLNVGIYGGLAIILLNISALVTDFALLRKFNIRKEIIDDQNAGTGVVQAAVYIGTGLILFGVLAHNEDAFWEILILWAVAQLAMILVGLMYNLITPYDIHDEIEKDNVAVGIGFAGALIAMANLIRFGVSVDAESWFEVGENLAFETGIGLLLLPVARLMTDKILLPKRKLTDEIVNQEKPNLGAAAIEAFAYIGGSILICWNFA